MSGMRATARGTLRGVALAAWTMLTAPVLLFTAALRVGSATAGARLGAVAFRLWARGAARIVGLTIVRTGVVPSGPFLLVANHLSYLDVVVLAATLDATFVAKSEVARWPLIGRLCSAVGTVFLDRTRKRDLLRVLALLEDELRAGRGIVIFPEGTTGDGSRVLAFKSSLFAAATRRALPVHLATLTYATPPGTMHPSRSVCWWGDMEFVRHLRALLRLPGCSARLDLAAGSIAGDDRKHLARAAERTIALRFVPVHQGEREWPPVPVPPTQTSACFVKA